MYVTAMETDRNTADPLIAVRRISIWRLLLGDPFVFLSLCWLVFVAVSAVIGPELLGDSAIRLNLRARNTPPGWGEFDRRVVIPNLMNYSGG